MTRTYVWIGARRANGCVARHRRVRGKRQGGNETGDGQLQTGKGDEGPGRRDGNRHLGIG
jgi:hypothetical protein